MDEPFRRTRTRHSAKYVCFVGAFGVEYTKYTPYMQRASARGIAKKSTYVGKCRILVRVGP